VRTVSCSSGVLFRIQAGYQSQTCTYVKTHDQTGEFCLRHVVCTLILLPTECVEPTLNHGLKRINYVEVRRREIAAPPPLCTSLITTSCPVGMSPPMSSD